MSKKFICFIFIIALMVVFSSIAFATSNGNENDLAYLKYSELKTTSGVGATDEIVVFESDIPKQGGTIRDIFTSMDGLLVDHQEVTLAELNAAPVVLVAGVAGERIQVQDVNVGIDGAFDALTTIDLVDSITGLTVCGLLQANLTDDNILCKGQTGFSPGLLLAESLTTAGSFSLSKTGSDATTGTKLTVSTSYTYL